MVKLLFCNQCNTNTETKHFWEADKKRR